MESLKKFSKRQKLSFAIQFAFIIFIATLIAIKMSSIISILHLLKDLDIALYTVLLILILINIGMYFYHFLANFDEWIKLRRIIKILEFLFLFSLLQFVVITLIGVLTYYVPWIYKFIYR